ncbi:MAG: AAA family ATPase, partial [SAR324 cluster bacterium]|nr:AAA family ATPase [SAR324 cluster bacterium]
MVLDHDDLYQIQPKIEIMMKQAHTGEIVKGLGQKSCSALRKLLAKDILLTRPLNSFIEQEGKAINQLTLDQFKYLDFSASHTRAAFCGGPGTGKTLLAYEKARRLAAEGKRTLLTCYNIPLEAYLKSQGKVENLTIMRFHQLCFYAAESASLSLLTPDQIKNSNESNYWNEYLPSSLEDNAESLEPFDAIVIDEGQDFSDSYWIPLLYCLKDPEKSDLFVFLDPNQDIYQSQSDLIKELPRFELQENLRNSQAIYQLASSLNLGGNQKSVGPKGRTPELIEIQDEGKLEKAIHKLLHKLIQEEAVKPEHIAVLTGRRPISLNLGSNGKLGSFLVTTSEAQKSNHLILDTIHRFKGLDAPIVILAGFEGIPESAINGLLYVGMTRAQSHLILLAHPALLAKFAVPVSDG